MRPVIRLLASPAFAFGLLASAQTQAQNAYITNLGSNTVSVIDTKTNTVIATIPVGSEPRGVAASPDGSRVYVTNRNSNNASVIAAASNSVIATIGGLGNSPQGVAVSPNGSKVYVTNLNSNTVSVIDATTNTFADSARSLPRRVRAPA